MTSTASASLPEKKVACPFCAALEKFELEKKDWHDRALTLANIETLKEVDKTIASGSLRTRAELFAYYFPDVYRKQYAQIEDENPEDKVFYKCLNKMSSDVDFKSRCCDRHTQVWKKYQ